MISRDFFLILLFLNLLYNSSSILLLSLLLDTMKKYLYRLLAYFSILTGFESVFAGIPTVYDRENTADSYPTLTFKEIQELPEIPTLPDPFTFADGTRSTDFADWERHRSEMLVFPDENHWILKPQNAILWQRTFFRFLDKYLK